MDDIVRVLRIIEYVGRRDRVEETVARSVQGTKDLGNGLVIKGATIGAYPEVIGHTIPLAQDRAIEDILGFNDVRFAR